VRFADRLPPPGSLWNVKSANVIFRHAPTSGQFNLRQGDRIIVVSCRFEDKFKRNAGFSVFDSMSTTRLPDQIWEYSFQMSIIINADPKSQRVVWNTDSIEKIQRAHDDMMPMTCLYELLSKWYENFERIE
jgi:hypothetical protein